MLRRRFDEAIPHAPELRDAFRSLMGEAAYKESRNPQLGIHDAHILLMYIEDDDAEKALAVCEAWANGRPVEWVALPPGGIDDPLQQRGYVGCRLRDDGGTPTPISTVRKWLKLPQTA